MTAQYKLSNTQTCTGVWVKNNDDPLFDVTMGSFYGAEVCELVGLHLFSKISVLIDSDNVGLCRDELMLVYVSFEYNN